MGKINKVSEGEFLYSIRDDGDRICNDCRFKRSCSEKQRVESLLELGVIAKIHGCSMYEKENNNNNKVIFGDLT